MQQNHCIAPAAHLSETGVVVYLLLQVTEQERAEHFQRQQERVARDLDRQRAELDAMLEVKLVKQQEAFEHELQQQLRRQVAAHTEHLKEALEEQKEELSRTFTLELEKKMVEERAQHNAALSSSVAKLQGMEEYLRARDELDRLSQQAKGLWLACQGLRHTLVHGPAGGPQSLSTDVQLVERAAPMSPYVPLVLASIPEEALARGVYPEVALKERFARVERACQRVALVDDKCPSSLLRYLASYLQSLCIIYPKEANQSSTSVSSVPLKMVGSRWRAAHEQKTADGSGEVVWVTVSGIAEAVGNARLRGSRARGSLAPPPLVIRNVL
ncbi:hypothetical protein V5799_024046 [Amblyomma americanum]|uniref:MICOS complex subunit MIC60 n=1 Tax=Amblyomma americanum TaxID=6943 RepID=A0AAQ4ED64_AMBAM